MMRGRVIMVKEGVYGEGEGGGGVEGRGGE